MDDATLSTDDLSRLIRLVFRPTAQDRSLALMTDLPDRASPDCPAWLRRRQLVADWHRQLHEVRDEIGFDRVSLIFYPNVRSNNADLPDRGWLYVDGPLPEEVAALDGSGIPIRELLTDHRIVLAVTQLSATAPMKNLAPQLGFRAATMPGFGVAMVPALRLDFEEIHQRCLDLKRLLDRADRAEIVFVADDREHRLALDLRHRSAIASGGLIREPGTVGNLPSGETYIVPYEGERAGDPSRTAGSLPLQLEDELLVLKVEGNRVNAVEGAGPIAAAEREAMANERAYANIAELGLGVLADYGVEPIGVTLLDEKLGLHIAFGRSDHFGGSTGPDAFSAPDRVVHIDRVYLPSLQPRVQLKSLDLFEEPAGSHPIPLMRDGRYLPI